MKMSKLFFARNGNRLTPLQDMFRKGSSLVVALGLGLGCFSKPTQALVILEFDGPSLTVTGRVNVAQSIPIGGAISPVYSRLSNVYGEVIALPGTGNTASYRFEIARQPVYGNDVYATNVPGIGVRYTITPGTHPRLTSSVVGPHNIQNGAFIWQLTPLFTGPFPPLTFESAVQFIKTANITANGAVTAIPPVRVVVTDHLNNRFPKVSLYSGVANATPINYTCTHPVPPAITLAPVPSSAFNGVGSTAGETPFNLSAINCTGDVQFKLSFNAGMNFQDPSISLLQNTLTGPVAATGYGIQIVEANRNLINASTKNFESTLDGRNFSQDFLARYYRHSTPATAGRVQSALVYTLDYY